MPKKTTAEQEIEQEREKSIFGDEMPADLIDNLCMQYNLTRKQLFFCEYYLQTLNARKSALKAGYTVASVTSTGSVLLSSPNVKNYLSQRFADLTMKPNEILGRLTDIARGDIGDYLKTTQTAESDVPVIYDGKILPGIYIDIAAALRDGNTARIKSFKRSKGETVIELHDPIKAMELIGKHQRMFVERVENVDKTPRNANDLPDDDLAAIAGAAIDILHERSRMQNAASGEAETPDVTDEPAAPQPARVTAFAPTGDRVRDLLDIERRLKMFDAMKHALSDVGIEEYRKLQALYAEITGGTAAAGNAGGDVFGEDDNE